LRRFLGKTADEIVAGLNSGFISIDIIIAFIATPLALVGAIAVELAINGII
jgi:hypothetical protein